MRKLQAWKTKTEGMKHENIGGFHVSPFKSVITSLLSSRSQSGHLTLLACYRRSFLLVLDN